MSFSIAPQAAPPPVAGPVAARTAAAEARAKAISILSGGAVQEQREAVANPSKISVEEMSAISGTKTDQSKSVALDSHEPTGNTAQTSEDAPTQASADKAPADEKKQLLSAQYAQLARKEQALRSRELALKAKEEALRASEGQKVSSQPSQQTSEDSISRQDLLKDPFGVLAKLGLTYDDLTQRAVNAPTPEQVAQEQLIEELRNEIRQIKTGQDETRKSIEDGQKRQYEQAVNQIKTEVKALVASDPEFEMVKATGSEGDVVELIEETFNKDGILLSVEEAAKQVEDYLLEETLKLQKLNKLQKRLQAGATAPQAPAATGDVKTQVAGNAPRTLSNQMSSTRQLTARERAVLAMQGKLNPV